MKRFNCEEAGCAICSRVWEVKKGLFGRKLYKCSKSRDWHKNIKANDCLEFRCKSPQTERKCRVCRKGEKRDR